MEDSWSSVYACISVLGKISTRKGLAVLEVMGRICFYLQEDSHSSTSAYFSMAPRQKERTVGYSNISISTFN